MSQVWTTGFEIELLAPPGSSRLDLATRAARLHGGWVRRFFHPQQEPSKVEGHATFENVTPGFEAVDRSGRPIARFVDDMTLQAGLDGQAGPRPGWYRIVTDDGRLMGLVMRHCDPADSLARVLAPLAGLFGTRVEPQGYGMVKVSDERGASVAIAAPLPGERERPCEIITPPLGAERGRVLDELLGEARAAAFGLPREGATHIHFDARPLLSAGAIANLVRVLTAHGAEIKSILGTNPNCIRLGPWPQTLRSLVESPGFSALDWPTARKALAGVGLSKYCDFNLANIVTGNPKKHTFEIRVLPASLNPRPILAAAELFSSLLGWCVEQSHCDPRVPADIPSLLSEHGLRPS